MTQMNLSTNRNRLTDIENRLAVAKGEENGGRMESEVAVTSRKLNIYRTDKQQGPAA